MRPEDDTVRIRREMARVHAAREKARQQIVDGIALEMDCTDLIARLLDALADAQRANLEQRPPLPKVVAT